MIAKDPALRPTAGEVEQALAALAAGDSRRGVSEQPRDRERHTVGREDERARLRRAYERSREAAAGS